jgi:dienelactone hydrolase
MKLLRLFSIILTLATAANSQWASQKDPKNLESWTNLSLDGSEFISVPPLMGQSDTQPLFTRHLIRLQWRVGDPIDTFLIIPQPDALAVKPAPKPSVILYLYNYATNTDRFMLTNVCQNLTAGGVAAVGFSPAVSGHRFHDRGATEWFVSNLQEALTTSAHDVQKVIDYLETREDIDTTRIGIFGQGSGAAVAILAAAVDPRIKVLDLEDAWGDWPEWLSKSTIIPEAERAAYLTPAFLKEVKELDPVRHLPKLKIPVRIQYSLPKSAVPPKVRKRMEAALPPQGAQTPVEANFNWIKKQLAEMGSRTKSTTNSRRAVKG